MDRSGLNKIKQTEQNFIYLFICETNALTYTREREKGFQYKATPQIPLKSYDNFSGQNGLNKTYQDRIEPNWTEQERIDQI